MPQFKGVQDAGSAEGSYFAWVDQFDTLRLGTNTPIATGNQSDAFLALKDGKWVVLRVSYPMGSHTKWLDGRIDNPNGGWKRPRTMVDGEQAHAIPHGNRQGDTAHRDAVPAQAGSAGEVALTFASAGRAFTGAGR